MSTEGCGGFRTFYVSWILKLDLVVRYLVLCVSFLFLVDMLTGLLFPEDRWRSLLRFCSGSGGLFP